MPLAGPRESTILAGKYRLLRPLGRGGMSSVWAAEHLGLHSTVAIKLLDAQIASHPDVIQRFLREAHMAATLRSPHVVQILDHGVDGDTSFIVMELLEGDSLEERLSSRHKLTPQETSRIITHVARAAARAHEEGIIHRDLKPGNIFLVHNDEEEIAKVLDFGVAKLKSAAVLGLDGTRTYAGTLLGSPLYMSPEQSEARHDLDHRTDIWSMGVIAYECLLGERPFEGETLASVFLAICTREMPVPSRRGPVPQGFDDWFAKACARDLSLRYDSAKQAAFDLRQICESPVGFASTVSALVVSPEQPPSSRAVVTEKPLRRSRTWPLLSLTLALAVALAAAAWFRYSPVTATGVDAPASPSVPPRGVLTEAPPVAPQQPVVVPLQEAPAPQAPSASAMPPRPQRHPTVTRSSRSQTSARAVSPPRASAVPRTKVDLGI